MEPQYVWICNRHSVWTVWAAYACGSSLVEYPPLYSDDALCFTNRTAAAGRISGVGLGLDAASMRPHLNVWRLDVQLPAMSDERV